MTTDTQPFNGWRNLETQVAFETLCGSGFFVTPEDPSDVALYTEQLKESWATWNWVPDPKLPAEFQPKPATHLIDFADLAFILLDDYDPD